MKSPKSLLLNSVPKSGTVLMSRILCEFIDEDDIFDSLWISEANIDEWNDQIISGKHITGHLILTPKTYSVVGKVRQILLLRDPVETVFSYANFFSSREMIGRSGLTDYIFKEDINRKVVLRHIVNGWDVNGQSYPPFATEWDMIASWHNLPGVRTVKYEKLLEAIETVEEGTGLAFFKDLLHFIGRDIYSEKQIVKKAKRASAKEDSPTWRGNIGLLDDGLDFPDDEDRKYVRSYLDAQVRRYHSL